MDAKPKRVFVPGASSNASGRLHVDYLDKLNDEELAFIRLFNVGVVLGYPSELAALGLTTEQKSQTTRENDAYKRDLFHKSTRITIVEDEHTKHTEDYRSEQFFSIKSEQFAYFKCLNCSKKGSECECTPKAKNASNYSQDDYRPKVQNEASMLTSIELNRLLQEKETAPYGDSPKGLLPGHRVQVCLPHHYFKDCYAEVVSYRPQNDQYLVKILNKQGVFHRNSGRAKEPLMYVSPEGLRRYTPKIAKK